MLNDNTDFVKKSKFFRGRIKKQGKKWPFPVQ
jgi:hypothetical protein